MGGGVGYIVIKIKLGLVAQCHILTDFDSAYQNLKIVENMKCLKILWSFLEFF